MEIRIFAHSWLSDWNHGNAHFLRGLACALNERGHKLRVYEPMGGWSLSNLFRHEPLVAAESIREFRVRYPHLDVRFYAALREPSGHGVGASASTPPGLAMQLEPEVRDAEVVLVHEWNDPELLRALVQLRRKYGFRLLFHDTHHRAWSDPQAIGRFPLDQIDAVLAFGEAVRRLYERNFGVKRTYTLHEAADEKNFYPLPVAPQQDVVWIGNWGDEERTRELHEFLLAPAVALRTRRFIVHGVRYPEEARQALSQSGVQYAGYLPNLRAPLVYAASGATLHIPRGPYRNGLGGIPTIRVFEALACGAALICSPWDDSENLFEPGRHFLVARDGREMAALIDEVLHSPRLREEIAQHGRETVLRRHTCAHRAAELEEICRELA